jgi:hypothetical protein
MKQENKSPRTNLHIIIVNILILVCYTVFFKLNKTGEFNFIADAVFIFLQFTLCLILAGIFQRFGKEFILSSFLILLIGFSTCYLSL